jgi:hypothetical protein
MYLNVSRFLKSVTDVKSDGLPSDGLTKIFCIEEDLDFLNVIPPANTSKLIEFLTFTLV